MACLPLSVEVTTSIGPRGSQVIERAAQEGLSPTQRNYLFDDGDDGNGRIKRNFHNQQIQLDNLFRRALYILPTVDQFWHLAHILSEA
jgi:hypothetical protein